MMNRIALMGRLATPVTIRTTQSGIPVANFRIAVERNYTAQNGGERETDFFDVTAWRGTAEFISKHFTKGQMLALEGRLETRGWTDRDGHKRTSVEIVAENVHFAGYKRDAAPQSSEYAAA